MGNKYFDLNVTEHHESGEGRWWDTAFTAYKWGEIYHTVKKALPGETLYFGCDPQMLTNWYLESGGIGVSRAGDNVEGVIKWEFGLWGAPISTELTERAWWIIGGRPNHHSRTDDDGGTLFSITADYQFFGGVRAKNFNYLIHIKTDMNKLTLRNTRFENGKCAIYCDANLLVKNLLIEGVHCKNLTEGMIRLSFNVENVVIRNFSVVNQQSEDGEFRGININNDPQNILIEDGEISGGIDRYFSTSPRRQYGSQDGDRHTYPGYTQGDGISIEETSHPGQQVIIRRVKCLAHTDRGFDVKSQCLIEDCTDRYSKRGYTLWASGSIARRCTVKQLRTAGNTPASAFLLEGNATLEYCEIQADGATACIYAAGGTSQKIIGGIIEATNTPIIRNGGGASCSVEFVNVTINGQLVNETVIVPADGRWSLD